MGGMREANLAALRIGIAPAGPVGTSASRDQWEPCQFEGLGLAWLVAVARPGALLLVRLERPENSPKAPKHVSWPW